jgi:hypothetical protein
MAAQRTDGEGRNVLTKRFGPKCYRLTIPRIGKVNRAGFFGGSLV